jgi:hypothetical protein
MVTGRRSITTVPTQALFMMNSALVVAHSQRTARRLMQMAKDGPARLEAAYQLILARAPSDEENATTPPRSSATSQRVTARTRS